MDIAIYTFNSSTDTLPTFNDGYDSSVTTETIINVVNDFIGPYTWDNMMNQNFTLPISSKIKLSDITKITVVNTDDTDYIGKEFKKASNSDHYSGLISSRTGFSVREVDGVLTFSCYEADSRALMPDVLEISIEYSKRSINIVDVDNGNGTITRTITSNTLPTSISFENKTGLVSLSYLDTSNVTDMSRMLYGCTNLTSIDISNFDTSNVTDMSWMFYNCTNLASLDLSNFNTSNVTDMFNMFSYCTNLTSLDISNFNTSIVTDMSGMFYGCENLTSVDVSSFNTSNVTSMFGMFYNCNLTSLDLSNFDTSKVTNIQQMFYNCNNLTSLNLNNFNISNVTDIGYMLNGCNNLTSVNMNDSNVDSINKIIAQLPTRAEDSYGTMTVSKNVLSSVDNTTANSKYWNVIKTPEYSFTLDTLKYLLTTIKSKFITKEEMNNKVDKIDGKQLSSNNFSDENVNNINSSFDDVEVVNNSNGSTLTFYSTSVDGTKTKIKDIDLDI